MTSTVSRRSHSSSHRQQHGFAHGGLLGCAADNALTFAAGAVAGPDVLTAGYTINVLAPVLSRGSARTGGVRAVREPRSWSVRLRPRPG